MGKQQEKNCHNGNGEKPTFTPQAFDAIVERVGKYFLQVIQDFNQGAGSCLDGKGLFEDVVDLCAPNLEGRERAIYDGLKMLRGKVELEDDFTCVLLLRTEISFVLGFVMAARHFSIDPHRFKDEIAPILQHCFCCTTCEKWDKRDHEDTANGDSTGALRRAADLHGPHKPLLQLLKRLEKNHPEAEAELLELCALVMNTYVPKNIE